MPGAFRTLFTPTTLLGYSTARKVYLLHHRRHPHPAWPVGKQEAEDTIEHIVPQSIYKRDPENRRIRCDMHNFFVLRGKLNGLKSNHPYSTLENTLFDNRLQLIRPDGTHHPLESPEHLSGRSDQVIHAIYRHRCQQTSKMKTVIIPPACLRGIIARSVAYMSTIYYDHADAMYSQVLDINTILRWHHQYPVTKYEYDRNMFIEIIQGNSNPYVKYPEMLPLALKAFDETIDLAFFKDYKYDVYFYGRATCGYDDVQTFSWAGQSIACKVVHVHDGDTLYVALEHPQTGHLIKFKVRLANINAFELQTEGGVSGRNALIAWITGEHSDTVEVKCNDRKAIHRLLKERSPLLWIELMDYDKFGRILGILKKHQDDAYDKSANAMMVQMGFAKCYMESY